MRFEHVYDKVGNKRYERRAWSGRDKGDFYTYDAIYRLTNVMYGVPGAELEAFKNSGTIPTTSEKTTNFNMDGVGNRTSVVDSQNGTTNYSTNNMNEYTIINGVVKANDESGNLIDDGTKTFKWDFANRLSEVYEKSTGNLIAKYKYDARGRRVARISGTTSGQGASSVSPLFDKRGGQPEAGRGVSAITNAKNPQARAARINALQSKIRGLENALAQHLKNNPNGTNTSPAPAPTPTVVPPVAKGKNKLQEFVESQTAGASDNAINNLTQELTQTYELLANELNLTGNCFWFYDGDEIVEQRDDTDTVMSSWVNGIQIDERIEIELSGIKYYYHLNTLGTVYALTDSTGAVVERYEYDSYGKVTIYDPTLSIVRTYSIVGNFSMFTGRQLDYETGLYYYRARMYDSETGRFLSHDPLGYVDGMGLYEYVKNNPIKFGDSYGTTIKISSNASLANFIIEEGIQYKISGMTDMLRNEIVGTQYWTPIMNINYPVMINGAPLRWTKEYAGETTLSGRRLNVVVNGRTFDLSGTTFSVTLPGAPVNLRQEIIYKMIRSKRTFNVPGDNTWEVVVNLNNHIDARLQIVNVAGQFANLIRQGIIGFSNDDLFYRDLWGYNALAEESRPLLQRGTLAELLNDIFTRRSVNRPSYAMGCWTAAQVVMMQGQSLSYQRTGGEDLARFNNTAQPFANDCKYMVNLETQNDDDWIPGDWGRFNNWAVVIDKKHAAIGGENVIYLGQTNLGVKMFFGQAGPKVNPIQSKENWFITIGNWQLACAANQQDLCRSCRRYIPTIKIEKWRRHPGRGLGI